MSAIEWSIESLRAFPETLRAFIATVPGETLDWRPKSWEGIPSEELTVRQQLCHLRDIEADGYIVRIKRVLAEQNPALASIDTYALIEPRNYDRTEVEAAIDAFTAARKKTMQILDAVEPEDFARRGAFEGYGDVTLAGLIHYLCSHDQQHLAGIQWLLGQHAAAR
ncbi:MAG: DinB family protein [Alphaproteobacteria bacterium]|jgi:hypothetical protein|nr:DinB family protein [Alphaproteobacteria bacterium]